LSDIEFDQPVVGVGWSAPEVAPDGRTYIWTNALNSTIDLGQAIEHPFVLDAKVYMAMSSDIIESAQFSVNGQSVPTETFSDASGETALRATVPKEALSTSSRGNTEIGIGISRTVVPGGGDDRTLGIAFDAIRFNCLEVAAGTTSSSSPSSDWTAVAMPSAINSSHTTEEATASDVVPPTTVPRASSTLSATLQCPPRHSAGSPVASTPCLSATPNPVPVVGERGIVTIEWSIGNLARGSRGQVYVAMDGRPEMLFATGRRGVAKARVRAGSVYEFRLYSGTNRAELLASMLVWTI
jgi:hypothetical protein